MSYATQVSSLRAATFASPAPAAANDSLDNIAPLERLSWLVELMSRYAREFMQSSDGHESPRLAAAIVAHLKSLGNELPASGRLTDASEHWFEMWDGILSQQLRRDDERSASLQALIDRARVF